MHELQSLNSKKKKVVGRGGRRGTTSGRGTKGQKSRTGSSVSPLFEGGRSSLFKRMKKLRGFNSPNPSKIAVSLTALDRAFADGASVSMVTLITAGVIRKSQQRRGAKIVGTGTLGKKLTIEGDIAMTATAEAAIKAAGGTIVA